MVHLLHEKVDLGSHVIGVYANFEMARIEATRLNTEAVMKYTEHWANSHWVESCEVIE